VLVGLILPLWLGQNQLERGGHVYEPQLASKWPTAFQRFKNQPAGGNHNQS